MKILDANVIIRYLVDGSSVQSEAIERLLKAEDRLWVSDVTVSEIVWVLSSYYHVERVGISERLESFLELDSVMVSNPLMLKQALEYYRKLNIDWVDCYTAAFALKKRIGKVVSYDRDFDKIEEIKREEP